MNAETNSIAHRHDPKVIGQGRYPDGFVPWIPATPPDVLSGRMVGSIRHCSYCGSAHPADIAAAIRAGAKGEWADLKYGWPHKSYFNRMPNPHAGMLESRSTHSSPPQAEIDAGKWVRVPKLVTPFDSQTGERQMRWVEAPQPAAATTWAKFYTVHLKDATHDDRKTIEQHLGFSFIFDEGRVRVMWRPCTYQDPTLPSWSSDYV